jgi:hypothetical protein
MIKGRNNRGVIQQRIGAFGDRTFEIICARLFLGNRCASLRKRKGGQQVSRMEVSRAAAERAVLATIDIERQVTSLIRELLSPLVGRMTQAALDEAVRNRPRHRDDAKAVPTRLDRLAHELAISIIERKNKTEHDVDSWCMVAKECLRAKPELTHAEIARYIAETWNPENNVVKKNGGPYKASYIAKVLRDGLV